MKTCGKCKLEKTFDEFHSSKSRGYQSYCKKCDSEYSANWARLNKSRKRGHKLQYKYKLNTSDVAMLLKMQGGKCEICQEELTTYVVDHNHGCCPTDITCGKCVRGLLCNRCNVLLGFLETNKGILYNAQAYIDRNTLQQ